MKKGFSVFILMFIIVMLTAAIPVFAENDANYYGDPLVDFGKKVPVDTEEDINTYYNYGVVNAINGLMLRSGPGTNYAALGTLNYGQGVKILQGVNDELGAPWYYVQVNSTLALGYVAAVYITITGIRPN